MNEYQRKSPRFRELDSMRGIAAIVVVFHHYCHMFYPQVVEGHTLLAYLIYPLVSGYESVILFFLLSGFVLSLPFLRGISQPYGLFICRRILRIYGPYLGALVLAVAGCAFWHNQFGTTGWASGTWYKPVDLHSVIQHLLFIGSYDDSQYNTAFWSLVHEMRISIIFPFLFYFVNRTRRLYAFWLVILCELAGFIHWHGRFIQTVQFTGIFALGILLAKNMDSVHSWFVRIGTTPRILLAVLSFTLYLGGNKIPIAWHIGSLVIALGAAGFMIFALNSIAVRNLLTTSTPSFLGKISYSLYLVHGTVLFAMTAMLKDKISHLSFFLLYLPASIFLSWIFYKLIEAPFTAISRSVGKRSTVLATVTVSSTD